MSDWTRADALRVREIIERMKLCGCGTDAAWEIVSFLLERGNRDEVGWLADKGFYSSADDASEKWVEFGAKVLGGWDLLEHGGGIGGAWLTDDGKLLLRFLRDFGLEGHDMEENTGHPLWSVEFSWDENAKPNDTFSEWERVRPSQPQKEQPK